MVPARPSERAALRKAVQSQRKHPENPNAAQPRARSQDGQTCRATRVLFVSLEVPRDDDSMTGREGQMLAGRDSRCLGLIERCHARRGQKRLEGNEELGLRFWIPRAGFGRMPRFCLFARVAGAGDLNISYIQDGIMHDRAVVTSQRLRCHFDRSVPRTSCTESLPFFRCGWKGIWEVSEIFNSACKGSAWASALQLRCRALGSLADLHQQCCHQQGYPRTTPLLLGSILGFEKPYKSNELGKNTRIPVRAEFCEWRLATSI